MRRAIFTVQLYLDGLYGCGSVFKLVPGSGGWTYSSLHDFTCGTDGAYPSAGVVMDWPATSMALRGTVAPTTAVLFLRSRHERRCQDSKASGYESPECVTRATRQTAPTCSTPGRWKCSSILLSNYSINLDLRIWGEFTFTPLDGWPGSRGCSRPGGMAMEWVKVVVFSHRFSFAGAHSFTPTESSQVVVSR